MHDIFWFLTVIRKHVPPSNRASTGLGPGGGGSLKTLGRSNFALTLTLSFVSQKRMLTVCENMSSNNALVTEKDKFVYPMLLRHISN